MKDGYVKLQVKRFSLHDDKSPMQHQHQHQQQHLVRQPQPQKQHPQQHPHQQLQELKVPQRRKSEPAKKEKEKETHSTSIPTASPYSVQNFRQILNSNSQLCFAKKSACSPSLFANIICNCNRSNFISTLWHFHLPNLTVV